MRILHLSDTHGQIPALEGDFDLVIHTGDFCPNRTYGVGAIEVEFQRYWASQEALRLHHSWWKAPVYVTPGNHDYIDVTPYLREVGIDAQPLVGFKVFQGHALYGFPWTPKFYDWNWMCGEEEMGERLRELGELLEAQCVDVLASHGPMYRVLDRNKEGEHCGCRQLRKLLIRALYQPKVHLHGHIHEAAGVAEVPWSTMRVSNAARTQRIVEV